MFTAIRLLLSGALERVLSALSAVLKWLLSDWRNGPLVWFFALFLVNAIIIKPAMREEVRGAESQRDTARAERDATKAAFEQTVAGYLAAAEQAERDAEANLARVEADQAAITQETIDDYESRIAAVRANADRLRAGALRAAPINTSGPGAANLPGSGDTATGADAAPGNPELPAGPNVCPSDFVCLTIDEALIATEQAIQLDALIDWNLGQAAVPFTPQEVSDAGQ